MLRDRRAAQAGARLRRPESLQIVDFRSTLKSTWPTAGSPRRCFSLEMRMTSPLDEISYKLGEVSAGLAILAGKAERQETQMAALADGFTDLKAHIEPLTSDIKWMKPQVRSYQNVRKNAAWVGSAIVVVFGAVGGALSDWIFKKFVG